MKNIASLNLLPAQYTGEKIDSEEDAVLGNSAEAHLFFIKVMKRLKQVNEWHHYAGKFSAKFQLTDANGKEITGNVEKGYFLKIDIPGSGSNAGDGYDWVQVEDVQHISETDNEAYGFRVRPAKNPEGKEDVISHFYAQESTSTFLVTRKGNKVMAGIYDRNTVPNKNAANLADRIRHFAAGVLGVHALSKLQWVGLLYGLLKKEKK